MTFETRWGATTYRDKMFVDMKMEARGLGTGTKLFLGKRTGWFHGTKLFVWRNQGFRSGTNPKECMEPGYTIGKEGPSRLLYIIL